MIMASHIWYFESGRFSDTNNVPRQGTLVSINHDMRMRSIEWSSVNMRYGLPVHCTFRLCLYINSFLIYNKFTRSDLIFYFQPIFFS